MNQINIIKFECSKIIKEVSEQNIKNAKKAVKLTMSGEKHKRNSQGNSQAGIWSGR